MSTAEIKTEIIKAIEADVPEKVLLEVLNRLKENDNRLNDETVINAHLKRIFEENDGLLRRLAQH